MIVHIGWDTCIESEDLIAIINKQTLRPPTSALLEELKRKRRFVPCREGEKAYVLVEEEDGERVYVSAIHPSTLHKRIRAGGLYDIV